MVRQYSSSAVETFLTGAINGSVTTIAVDSVSGFPLTFPYTLSIDAANVSKELVEVTAAVGTTLTVTRAIDGTAGVSHLLGAVVEHAHSARDFAESRAHEAATTNVHGVTGALASATDLSNHIADATDAHDATAISFSPAGGIAATDVQAAIVEDAGDLAAHLADAADAHDASAISFAPTGTIAATDVQAAIAEVADEAADDSTLTAHSAATTGVHGVGAGSVVGTTLSQTLTNKGLTAPSITAAVLDGFDLDGNTTPYTPTWASASNPQPDIGNGSITGSYQRIGATVLVRILLVAGSTTTFGTGQWKFSLPWSLTNVTRELFTTFMRDSSAGATYPGRAVVNDLNSLTDIFVFREPTTAGGALTATVTATAPFTWTDDDELSITGLYYSTDVF